MSNVTISTCVLVVDAYYCKDMFRIRADILESREGGSIRFSEYSRNKFDKEIDAWNFLDKFRTIIEELYDKKVFVTCYVVKNENGREILMSRLR